MKTTPWIAAVVMVFLPALSAQTLLKDTGRQLGKGAKAAGKAAGKVSGVGLKKAGRASRAGGKKAAHFSAKKVNQGSAKLEEKTR